MGNSGNGFTKGLLIGSIVGAGVALLYAPKSGEDLRADMGRKADDLKNDMGRYMKRLRKSSDDLIGKARESVEAVANTVTGHNSGHEIAQAVKESAAKIRTH